jgi:pimeloyl-ACP methyl ester carboxylesterase
LVISGEHDAIAPPAALEAITHDLSSARFVTIEEADHFFGAGLTEVGAAITKWLARD